MRLVLYIQIQVPKQSFGDALIAFVAAVAQQGPNTLAGLLVDPHALWVFGIDSNDTQIGDALFAANQADMERPDSPPGLRATLVSASPQPRLAHPKAS